MINAQDFNRQTNQSTDFNCLAFALGQTQSKGPYFFELRFKDPDDVTIPIYRSFLWKAQDLNLQVRRASSLKDLKGHVGFLVYGWYRFGDFHIVRINLDGTWEHKPDYNLPATETTEEELKREYPEGPAEYFILID